MKELIHSRSQEETGHLARELSLWARPGMVILLSGDLGTGKSVFARAFLRALAENDALDVPSPTFTLIQSYEETRIPAFHADLYRLEKQADIEELGFSDLLATHVGLIEWAERMPAPPSADWLKIALRGDGDTREIELEPAGRWIAALDRNRDIKSFLSRSGKWKGQRHFLEGDASSRRYEWIETADGAKPLLMDMARRPDGPPVKDGKSYSTIAHLAEDIRPVLQVNALLGETFPFFAYSVPKVHDFDIGQGLALIENLQGKVYGRMLLAGEDMTEPMLTAAEVLADMALKPCIEKHDFARLGTFAPKAYDEEAILIEVDLLPSWFWPYVNDVPAPDEVRTTFANIWRKLVPLTQETPPVLVLRDFHSPNLIWLPEREGIKRVGLIDTQDAVLGHTAYDLASLIQDARVDIPEALAARTYEHYITYRKKTAPRIGTWSGRPFDEQAFATSYAVLGAQRATKILGIFARLSKRDGKHGYLRHMPRVSRALAKNLDHPALAELKAWYVKNMPKALALT